MVGSFARIIFGSSCCNDPSQQLALDGSFERQRHVPLSTSAAVFWGSSHFGRAFFGAAPWRLVT
eukprot:3937146-Pyramimonas_sp.AAC.1